MTAPEHRPGSRRAAPTLRITVVVDNHAGGDLTAEHGLALWIETDGRRILFDTGQGGALEANARGLGIDLSRADRVVLSHGHGDHTGGLAQVLLRADHAAVFCHPGALEPRYSVRAGMAKPIGMPTPARSALAALPEHRRHAVLEAVMISARVGLTGPIPRRTAYEDTGGPFFLDGEGCRVDPIADEIALWIRTDSGIVVCTGCAHAGVVNTLHQVQRQNPGRPIRAVIGGFHLVNANAERMARTIAALQEIALEQILPCHCTGDHAATAIQSAIGQKAVTLATAGQTYSF